MKTMRTKALMVVMMIAVTLAFWGQPTSAQLAHCPDCRGQVSMRAEQCPACGCPAAHFVAVKNVSAQMESSVLLLRGTFKGREMSTGTAFIVTMQGRPYVVTNQHLVAGADALELQTPKGYKFVPSGAEVLADGDLIRFPASPEQVQKLGLSPLPLRETAPRIGEAVAVFGNSGGAGVITRLEGKVLGVSATLIEVDATFIGGNSGSPVVDVNGAVVGVATFATWDRPDWVAQNTRFADVRRFSLRLPQTGGQWRRSTLQAYQTEARKLYDIENFAHCTAVVFTHGEEFIELFKPSDVRAMFADTHYAETIFAHVRHARQLAQMRDVDQRVAGLRAECLKMERDLQESKRQLAPSPGGWSSAFLATEAERIAYVIDQCLLLARSGGKLANEAGRQRQAEKRAIHGTWREVRDGLWNLQSALYTIRLNMEQTGPPKERAYKRLRELMRGKGLESDLFYHFLGYLPDRLPGVGEVTRVENAARNAYSHFSQARTDADKERCLRMLINE